MAEQLAACSSGCAVGFCSGSTGVIQKNEFEKD